MGARDPLVRQEAEGSAIEVVAPPALIEVVRLGTGIGLLKSAALTPAIERELIVRPFKPELRLRSRVVPPSGRPFSRDAGRMVEIYRGVVVLH